MYQQLVKELAEFEKEYRAYSEDEVQKLNMKENVKKTAVWVAAKILLKHLKDKKV